MSYAERHAVALTTDASGDATGYTPVITGRIINVIYTKTDFADTVDFTITVEGTGQGLWTEENVTASKTVAPKQALHDVVGAGVTYDGTNEIYGDVMVAKDRVKIVVAQGGDTTSGTFDVIVA